MPTDSQPTAPALIDLRRYPIADLRVAAGCELAADCRKAFSDTGLCALPGFVRPNALNALAREAEALADRAFFCHSSHTAYLANPDGRFPAHDPRGRVEETHVGSIAYDLFPEDALLRRLYGWDPLKDFIAAVLDKPVLYRFADPLGACSVNVFREGGQHAWHFDEAEFTVTLMLQAPESGGSFEYVPSLRGAADEAARVAAILDGDREGVVELPFTPGTLLIFGGRNTLHRVTRVSGKRPRLVPVLCYSVQSDLMNSEDVRLLFWGRRKVEAA